MTELEAACEVLNRRAFAGHTDWVCIWSDGPIVAPKDDYNDGVSGEVALAVARALEPDPQAEADRELGAALGAVLEIKGTVRICRDGAGWQAGVKDDRHRFADTPAAALRALAARLAGDGAS